jgi:hypothetical protein
VPLPRAPVLPRKPIRDKGLHVKVSEFDEMSDAVPVPHTGNQNCAPEEAQAVAALLNDLLDGQARWTDRKGKEHPPHPCRRFLGYGTSS